MKLYLAAMYAWMEKMREEREKYRARGHVVTSQWIDGVGPEMTRDAAATMDLSDLEEADALVLYTLPVGTAFTSGGRMVELGYAVGRGKMIYLVGERENVFCHLKAIQVFSSTEDLLYHLGDVPAKAPLSFPNRAIFPQNPAVFDDGELAASASSSCAGILHPSGEGRTQKQDHVMRDDLGKLVSRSPSPTNGKR